MTKSLSPTPSRPRFLPLLSLTLFFIGTLHAATCTWTGGGATFFFSDKDNWGGTAPVAGDDLVFPDGTIPRKTANCDSPTGTVFNSVKFEGKGYSIAAGNLGVTITNGFTCTNTASGSFPNNVWSVPILCNTNLPVNVSVLSSTLDIRSEISGTGTLTKSGSGILFLTQTCTYTGDTNVTAGRLFINESNPATKVNLTGGSVACAGTNLGSSNGECGDLLCTGGALDCLNQAPHHLTCKNLSLNSASGFVASIMGSTPGTNSFLVTCNSVDLGGCTFSGSIGATIPPDTKLTLIDNVGPNPVNGTFSGIGDGANVVIGGSIFTLTYKGGDGNDVVLTKSQVNSTVTLTPSNLTPTTGDTVTLNVTVSSSIASGISAGGTSSARAGGVIFPTPNGSVEYYDGTGLLATIQLNASGAANYDVNNISNGTHNYTAKYKGNSNYNPGQDSKSVTASAGKPAANTFFNASPPTVTAGRPIELDLGVTSPGGAGPTPTGTVTFIVDGINVGVANLQEFGSGGATAKVSLPNGLTAGPHTVETHYSGDNTYSSSDRTDTFTVGEKPAGMVLDLNRTVTEGTAFDLSPNVRTPDPKHPAEGTVTVTIDGVVIGTYNLQSPGNGLSVASVPFPNGLPVGQHTVQVHYSGDSILGASDNTGTITVTPKPPARVSLTSGNTATFGSPIILSAEVRSPVITHNPTGTVTFIVDGVSVGVANVATINSGISTCGFTLPNGLPLGPHTVTLHYSGDDTLPPGDTTGTVTVVEKFTSKIDIASSSPAVVGSDFKIDLLVSGGSTAPTGVVNYTLDTLPGGVIQLSPTTDLKGAGTLTIPGGLSAGTHNFEFKYAGDATHESCTSQSSITCVGPCVHFEISNVFLVPITKDFNFSEVDIVFQATNPSSGESLFKHDPTPLDPNANNDPTLHNELSGLKVESIDEAGVATEVPLDSLHLASASKRHIRITFPGNEKYCYFSKDYYFVYDRLDSDGDGYTDSAESKLGSDPNNKNSTPNASDMPAPDPGKTDKTSAGVNVDNNNDTGSYNFKGSLTLPEGSDLFVTDVVVEFGKDSTQFHLDAKGKGTEAGPKAARASKSKTTAQVSKPKNNVVSFKCTVEVAAREWAKAILSWKFIPMNERAIDVNNPGTRKLQNL